MATKAGRIILEVKRKIGGVNSATPNETDIMAFLNMALRGIWNYGVQLDSPRLEINEDKICGATGIITLAKPPIKVTRVFDIDNTRDISRYAPRGASGFMGVTGRGMWGFCDTITGIDILQSSDSTGGNVRVTYFPEYASIKRADPLPFDSTIDSIVAAWTIRLIKEKDNPVSDMSNAVQMIGANSLVMYFEGQAEENYIGVCPW